MVDFQKHGFSSSLLTRMLAKTERMAYEFIMSNPFVFLSPVAGEVLEVGSTVKISWSGGPALPQHVVLSLVNINKWAVVGTGISSNYLNNSSIGVFEYTIPTNFFQQNAAGSPTDKFQFYIQDVAQTTWTYGPQVSIAITNAFCFIKSKLDGNVIDIQGASAQAGALLDAYPQKSSGTDNQLWEFAPDPAGSGYSFIKSKLDENVIDIQGASTKAAASIGTPAATAYRRLSCSFWLEAMPGSSAETMTSAPLTPV